MLGRELALGDIVAYPSGSHMDYAVITKLTPSTATYEIYDDYRLSTKIGMIEGKQFYMLRRWNDLHQQTINKGFRTRRKELSDRVLLKISEDEFMQSLLTAEEKQAVLTLIRTIRQ